MNYSETFIKGVYMIEPRLFKGSFRMLMSLMVVLLFASCNQQSGSSVTEGDSEDLEKKALLQGTWIDEVTEEVSFRAQGDTIYFADGTSLPAYFRIVGDSIELGNNTYYIERQGEHLFWFHNQVGDLVKLVKRDEDADDGEVMPVQMEVPPVVTEVINRDSVVMVGGERYHWYVTINPTRYRVIRTTYNADGVGVENVYFDNIIHVSLFHNGQRVFSQNFKKQMFGQDVPKQFLSQAILGNIQYDHADAQGFYFHATLCIPDEASCYMVQILVRLNGDTSMELLEY